MLGLEVFGIESVDGLNLYIQPHMEDLSLPPRLIAAGHKPFGHRVNIYQKMSIIEQIRGYLNKEELDYILRSPLGRLFEYPNKPTWSGGFGLFLLSRQLEIAKENEIWILFAGKPIRFSLWEFKIVTGLPCGKYPKEDKKKQKTKVKKTEEFYGKLFGREENVKVDRVLSLLQSVDEADRENRLRFACLALVDGILLPTTHYPKAKIVKEHVEMVENLEKFLQYPWGRKSFDRMMTTIKERDLAQLATADVAVQGLFIALQAVVFEAVPAILGENSSGEEEDDDFVEQQPRQFKLSHVRELDESSDVSYSSGFLL